MIKALTQKEIRRSLNRQLMTTLKPIFSGVRMDLAAVNISYTSESVALFGSIAYTSTCRTSSEGKCISNPRIRANSNHGAFFQIDSVNTDKVICVTALSHGWDNSVEFKTARDEDSWPSPSVTVTRHPDRHRFLGARRAGPVQRMNERK